MQPEHTNIGYLLNKATLILRRKLADELASHDITPAQWSVLRDLAHQATLSEGGPHTSPAQIAERLEMDRPTLSGIMDRLQKKEWVTIRTNPKDRRSQLVELTEQAAQLIPSLERASQQVLQQALLHIAGDQITILQTTLLQMIMNLQGGDEA